MKTVMKKIFSLMLVAVLLVSAVPFAASAAETYDLSIDVNGVNKLVTNGTSTSYDECLVPLVTSLFTPLTSMDRS